MGAWGRQSVSPMTSRITQGSVNPGPLNPVPMKYPSAAGHRCIPAGPRCPCALSQLYHPAVPGLQAFWTVTLAVWSVTTNTGLNFRFLLVSKPHCSCALTLGLGKAQQAECQRHNLRVRLSLLDSLKCLG